MNRKQIFILHLLNCAIHSIKPHPEEFLPEEWEKLLQGLYEIRNFCCCFSIGGIFKILISVSGTPSVAFACGVGTAAVSFFSEFGKCRRERSSLKEASAVCSNRLSLLKEYELMDEKQRLSLH